MQPDPISYHSTRSMLASVICFRFSAPIGAAIRPLTSQSCPPLNSCCEELDCHLCGRMIDPSLTGSLVVCRSVIGHSQSRLEGDGGGGGGE